MSHVIDEPLGMRCPVRRTAVMQPVRLSTSCAWRRPACLPPPGQSFRQTRGTRGSLELSDAGRPVLQDTITVSRTVQSVLLTSRLCSHEGPCSTCIYATSRSTQSRHGTQQDYTSRSWARIASHYGSPRIILRHTGAEDWGGSRAGGMGRPTSARGLCARRHSTLPAGGTCAQTLHLEI